MHGSGRVPGTTSGHAGIPGSWVKGTCGRRQSNPSSETSDVRWVPLASVGSLQMDPSMRQRVEHVSEKRDSPYIG